MPRLQFGIFYFCNVEFCTLLSTCDEVTFAASIYLLLCYFACKHVITRAEMCAI